MTIKRHLQLKIVYNKNTVKRDILWNMDIFMDNY